MQSTKLLCSVLFFVGLSSGVLANDPLAAVQAVAIEEVEEGQAKAKRNAENPEAQGEQNENEDEANGKGGDKPKGEAKADDDKGEKGDTGSKDKEDKEADEPKDIQRPTEPETPADPNELKATPDPNGRVRFYFHNQKWQDFLEWMAEAGEYTLDWEKLPGGHVSIATRRAYPIDEAMDMVNRLLMERGFTTVLRNEVLSVLKLKELDPSLIPTVDEEELLDLKPFSFSKVTFQLPEDIQAGQFAEDVKLILSPYGKVQALVATNRIRVLDAVINLREVSSVVNGEHASLLSKVTPTEFTLEHVRADYVADQVMIVLGLDPSSRRSPQELQVEQQRLQLFMQMQQKGKDITKYLRKGEGASIFLAVNKRLNTLIVNAPAKELKIVERTVKLLDVPNAVAEGALAGSDGGRLERYQLVTLSPQSVVTALEQIGDLDPKTQIKTDTDASVIFAFATDSDHKKIQSVIDSLDGSGRQFEVMPLRRLPAKGVAASIHKLMVGEEKKKNNRYGWGWDEEQEKKKPNEGFRIDADVENNRIILWANESEIKEVKTLLTKLGENPDRRSTGGNYRMIPAVKADKTKSLIEEVKQIWPNVGDNPIEVEIQPKDEELAPEVEEAAIRANQPQLRRLQPVSIKKPSSQAEGDLAKIDDPLPQVRQAPRINVVVQKNGQWIISSRDTEALDQLEDLIARLSQSSQAYPVFYLKYASASLVTLNLEEYFEDEGSFDEEDNWRRAWHGLDFASSRGTGLGAAREIRFIWDIDTNSILVRNASPEQLQIVTDLVELYDKPPSEESYSARRLQLFPLKYAQAEQVAATIKEVYRDLLSSKDKEFDRPGQEKKQESSQTRQIYRIYDGGDDNDKKSSKKVKASFAGALSIGVDPTTNTLIVSAQEEWMDSISQMINRLDERAEPFSPAFRVHKVKSGIDSASLYTALNNLVGEKAAAARKSGEGRPQAEQKQGEQPSEPTVQPSE